MIVQFQIVFAATNKPQQVPVFQVAPGMSVTVQGINGQAVNANPCYIGEFPESLGTSSSRVVPAGGDVTVPWPVNNTGQIWAQGTAGDGLLVLIQQAQVG